ncbi:MAG: S8/S53 family peptidase [Bacteroidota bacterium]
MKRIILKKNLFVREGFPSTSSPKVSLLRKNRITNFLRKVKGESHKGVDEWYEIAKDKFIWAGGTKIATSYSPNSWRFSIRNSNVIEKADRLPEKIRDMGLPILWDLYESAETPRKKVKVAILDTGVDAQNAFLKDRIKNDKCFNARMRKPPSAAEGIDKVPDLDGHGTYCAGLLAADKPPFIGAAYDCDLHIVKIVKGRNFGIRKEVLDRAVDWCISKEIDIISLSFSMNQEIYQRKGFESCISRARQNNIVWVASIGNDPQNIRFPGGSSSCIGVGAIDARTFEGGISSPFLPQEFLFTPSAELLPLDFLDETMRESFPKPEGSSFATPIATGFVALVHSLSSSRDPDTLKKILKENTQNMVVSSLPNPYPVIQFSIPISIG